MASFIRASIILLACLPWGGCGAGASSEPPLSDGLIGPTPAPAYAPAAAAQQTAAQTSVPLGAKPAPPAPPVPWTRRIGPAYPNDPWKSTKQDLKELPATVWDDTKAIAADPWALGGLAIAGATGLAFAGNRGNDQVADHFAKTGNPLHGFWDSVGDAGGSPGAHFALAGAMYAYSLSAGDTRTHEVSKTLLNALCINGVANLALKATFHTDSPNGDPWGWPSGHTSSSFVVASVMHEAYGPWVGAPFYAFATYVGYERCAARNHDFNDVISGAIMGLVIGHSVAGNHRLRILGADVVPVINPSTGVMGLGLLKQW